jgi:hypothetical protein
MHFWASMHAPICLFYAVNSTMVLCRLVANWKSFESSRVMLARAPRASVIDFHARAFKTFQSYEYETTFIKETNITHFWAAYARRGIIGKVITDNIGFINTREGLEP